MVIFSAIILTILGSDKYVVDNTGRQMTSNHFTSA